MFTEQPKKICQNVDPLRKKLNLRISFRETTIKLNNKWRHNNKTKIN